MGIHSLFPAASKEELQRMRNVYTKFTKYEDAYVCARVKYLEDDSPYVDVYIWDKRWKEGYMRLVISDQFYWSEEEERNFRYYLKLCTYMLKSEYEMLYELALKAYPEIHLKTYDFNRIEILAHLYYATHWIYPEEKLYKAGLPVLALHLQEVLDYNEGGKSPSEILGLPLKLLRCLCCPQSIQLIITQERREKLLAMYRKFQSIFERKGKVLSYGQLLCLFDLMEGIVLCKDSEFDEMFTFIERYGSREEYESYKKYLELRDEVKEYLEFPLCSEFMDELAADEKKDVIIEYIRGKEYIDKCFQEIREENAEKYEFEDDKYLIRLPGNLEELLIESAVLSNCLWRYVPELMNKKTTVLFLRKKNDVNRPYVAVEISNEGIIIQARGRFNNPVVGEAKEWLWAYAQKKGFNANYLMDCDEEEWD